MLATILVVDDDPNILDLVRMTLQPTGWKIITAQNGPNALEMAHYHQPDLILLDLIMPGMNGYEVCTLLRAHKRFRTVPIVSLTGATERSEHALALQAGADGVITKPISPQALTERLRQFLVTASMGCH